MAGILGTFRDLFQLTGVWLAGGTAPADQTPTQPSPATRTAYAIGLARSAYADLDTRTATATRQIRTIYTRPVV